MKSVIINFDSTVDNYIQVLTNLCIYCMGDIYISEDTVECQFSSEEDKEYFLREIDDLDIKPI
jgi:hypothetical protein